MVQEETWHVDMFLSYKKDLDMNGFDIGLMCCIVMFKVFMPVYSNGIAYCTI
jgi:hypothetical protein